MPDVSAKKRLKKELRLRDVYAIATGATLSAGFFLLPGIAATEAGPALVLAYLLAALPLIPAMFSVVELATAMPRAGGVYYFLDRSLGPFLGCIGGIGTWLALILKVTFALVGMGAYIALFLPNLSITPIAVAIALSHSAAINLVGAKKSGGLQVVLVFGLLAILAIFLSSGVPAFQPAHFQDFFAAGFDSIIATAGHGLHQLCRRDQGGQPLGGGEEIRRETCPEGSSWPLLTAILIYLLGTMIIVGLVPRAELQGNLTPVATAAEYALGRPGVILLSLAALLAFVSVANAGMMSASRYPLAMSRDHCCPAGFREAGQVRHAILFHSADPGDHDPDPGSLRSDADRQAGQRLPAAHVRPGLSRRHRDAREPNPLLRPGIQIAFLPVDADRRNHFAVLPDFRDGSRCRSASRLGLIVVSSLLVPLLRA